MDEEAYEETTGCMFDHGVEEECPECCSCGGWYAAGTEQCEFCSYRDLCIEAQNDHKG